MRLSPLILVVSLLLFVSLIGLGRAIVASNNSQDDKNQSNNLIRIEPPIINLGEVSEGLHTATARIVNNSDAAIRIAKINTSCSCSDPKYSKDWIPAGETMDFSCTWDTRGRIGNTGTNLAIYLEPRISHPSNDASPNQKIEFFEMQLPLTAQIVSRWDFSPKVLQFIAGTPATKEITLKSPDSLPKVSITDAEPSHHAIKTEVVRSSKSQDVLRVTFDPAEWTHGPMDILVVSDCNELPTKRIPVWVRKPKESQKK